jgi:hypothetical protein
MLPLVTAEALDSGRIAADPMRGAYSFELDVQPADPTRGWVVFLRAEDPSFRPEAGDMPCTRLRWKLDEENEHAWRVLDENESILLENPGGGRTSLRLDVSVDLGWNIEPGTYSLGLVFRAASL